MRCKPQLFFQSTAARVDEIHRVPTPSKLSNVGSLLASKISAVSMNTPAVARAHRNGEPGSLVGPLPRSFWSSTKFDTLSTQYR